MAPPVRPMVPQHKAIQPQDVQDYKGVWLHLPSVKANVKGFYQLDEDENWVSTRGDGTAKKRGESRQPSDLAKVCYFGYTELLVLLSLLRHIYIMSSAQECDPANGRNEGERGSCLPPQW